LKKIVTLTGHKNCKKDIVASRLSENSDVEWIKPYVGINLPKGVEPIEMADRFHIVLPQVLEDMIRQEKVLYKILINGKWYVFFEFQLTHDYNVMILDDLGVITLWDKDVWAGETYNIFVTSKQETPSERVGEYLNKTDFDEVFDADVGDIHELEVRIA